MDRLKWAFGLALLVGMFVTVPLGAANPPAPIANWNNLKVLAPGDNVRVVLNNMKSYRGKFESFADNAIVVRLSSGNQTFTRNSILRVSTKGQWHRLR